MLFRRGIIPLKAPKAVEKRDKVANILKIIQGSQRQKVAVFSHDDPDGIISALLLCRLLKKYGAFVEVRFPPAFRLTAREIVGLGYKPDVLFILDKGTYARLASAVHKNCVDPRLMVERGYDVMIYSGDWQNHPIYMKDIIPPINGSNGSQKNDILDVDSKSAEVFDIDTYISHLRDQFPLDQAMICSYSGISPSQAEKLIGNDRENSNFRIDYLNLVCISLRENDSIPKESKTFFQGLIKKDQRTGKQERVRMLRNLGNVMGG